MIRETEADRARQTAVADRLATAWRVHAYPMPHRCPIDYLTFNPRSLGWAAVEIKCRNQPSTAQPTLMIDAAKIIALATWAANFRASGVVVVRYADDVIEWLDIADIGPLPLDLGGRSDRGDPADRDPVLRIPRDLFRRLP